MNIELNQSASLTQFYLIHPVNGKTKLVTADFLLISNGPYADPFYRITVDGIIYEIQLSNISGKVIRQ
jgi:hypothetical protein